jgi:metallo-beta-lactamase family protein
MCTGGRIKHHLANNIEDPKCTVLFVGYQAHGTLGRLILDGKNPVRILGREWQVRAKIDQVQGLSAHADIHGLKHWLSELEQPPTKTFVVHGEEESALAFARTLGDEHGWSAVAPEYGDRFELT